MLKDYWREPAPNGGHVRRRDRRAVARLWHERSSDTSPLVA